MPMKPLLESVLNPRLNFGTASYSAFACDFANRFRPY